MRVIFSMMVCTAAITGAAAQSNNPMDKPAGSPDRGGRTYMPMHQKHIEQQPQGPTGPLDTTVGGAPAESPQGQSPPGMQAAPEGSSKTIIDDKR